MDPCVSGANCQPIGTTEPRPIRGLYQAPDRVQAREEPRHLTRSGWFPSSEVCRGTASGCCCWACSPSPPRTPPHPYAVCSTGQATQESNPFRPGTVSWWDRSPLRNQGEQIPFLGEDRDPWVKNTHHRDLPSVATLRRT